MTLVALLAATGCIRSTVRFDSSPQGADLFVNEQLKGRTPVDMPFIWYWFYDVRLEKEGYKTLKAQERFRTPWYAVFPLDFFAEAAPFPIYDRRSRSYTLTPAETAEAAE
jgi:hypothetical protein